MAVSRLGTKTVRGLEAMCKYYRKLGFEPDIVKTLMSKRKGHFLNRLYCDGHEVLTPAKIFARCDRDHERKLTTIHDRVNAVFGSMWGALDRGADPIWAYYIAHWRALCLVIQVGGKSWRPDSSFTMISCWLTPGLGGMGIPSFAHWAARDSTTTLASALGLISRISRTVKKTEPTVYKATQDVLYSIAHSKVQSKSYVAYMDDPFSISLEGIIDPAMPALKVMKKAQQKAITDTTFRNMLDRSDSEDYENAIGAFLKSASYPAPIVAELSSALAHSTIRALTVKAERNEALLKLVSHRDRKDAINQIKRLNRAFIKAMKNCIQHIDNSTGDEIDSIYVLRHLDISIQSAMGTSLTMTVRPSICDLLTPVDNIADSLMILSLPDHTPDEMFEGKGQCSLKRSKKSTSLVLFKHADDDAWDPITRAYSVAMNCCCMLSVLGYDASVASALFGMSWVGLNQIAYPRIPRQAGANAARICGRTARVTHTCAAFPNAVSQVSVPMPRFIAKFEQSRLTFDPLAATYVLKAAGLADMAINRGTAGKPIRGYTIRQYVGVVESNVDTAVDLSCIAVIKKMSPVLTGNQARRAIELFTDAAAEAMAVEEEDDGEDLGINPANVPARTAMNILARIPAGEFLNMMIRYTAAGAAHEIISERANADVTASDPGNVARARTLASINSAELGHAVVRIANVIQSFSVYSSDAQIKMQKLISNDGKVLRALGISRNAQELADVNGVGPDHDYHLAVMSKAIIGDGSSLSNDPVAFWSGFVKKHASNAADATSGVKRKYRSTVIAGGISIWVETHGRNLVASTIWAATVVKAMKNVSAMFNSVRRVSVPLEVFSRIERNIGYYLDARNGRVDGGASNIANIVCNSLLGSDKRNVSRQIRSGVYNGLNQLWTYFKSDLIVPIATRERAEFGAQLHDVAPTDNVVVLPDVEDVVDIQAVEMEAVSWKNDPLWQEYSAEAGLLELDDETKVMWKEAFEDWKVNRIHHDADVA
jgi:hypothetical protein